MLFPSVPLRFRRAGCNFCLPFLEPSARHGLKRVRCPFPRFGLLRLLYRARVDTIGEQFPGFVPALAGFLEADFRMPAHGQPLFFPLKAVFEPPEPAARG
jgi:hypothetical protein